MSSTTLVPSQPSDVSRLQALSRLLWQVLLGYPQLEPTVLDTLGPLTRRNETLARDLAAWRGAAAASRHRVSGARGALQRTTRALAARLANEDGFGAAARALRHSTRAALEGFSDSGALAHLVSVDHVFDQYQRARAQTLTRHLGLVRLAARQLKVAPEHWADLVHEGVFGLARAFERFDPAKGTKFSTYAMYWIRSKILRARARLNRQVHVPAHVMTTRRRYARQQAMLDRGQPQTQLREEARAAVGLTTRQLRAIESVPISEPATLRELELEARIDPEDALDRRDRHEHLARALPVLTDREQRILEHRFELEGRPFRTFEQLGRELGLSRERVRQIQLGALDKLRAALPAA